MAVDLDGLESAIAIHSRTLTLEFDRIATAYGIQAAVGWLSLHKDINYPLGFNRAKFSKNGGHVWLDRVRAQNINIPDEVVSLRGNDFDKGYIVQGIVDVVDSKNEVNMVFWQYTPGEPVKKILIKKTPNGFHVVPMCEDCNGLEDTYHRTPSGNPTTIDGFVLPFGGGGTGVNPISELIDFIGILNQLFPNDPAQENDRVVIPDPVTVVRRVKSGEPYFKPNEQILEQKTHDKDKNAVFTVPGHTVQTIRVDSSNGNSTLIKERTPSQRKYKNTPTGSGGHTPKQVK